MKFTANFSKPLDVSANLGGENKMPTGFGGGVLINGKDGKSAYQIAVDKGFKGSEDEWLASLQGEDGKDGQNGIDGKDGKNGISVQHRWQGTTLTITSESGTSSAELKGEKGDKGDKGEKGDAGAQGAQGVQGVKGDKGEGFSISKTYPSVSAMQQGFSTDGVPLNGFVLINTGNVNDEDNAKLFVKLQNGYSYLTDLSGSQGIKGERGDDGHTPIKGTDYFTPADKQEIVKEAASLVEAPESVWEKVDGENGIRLKGTNGTASGNHAISAGDDKTASNGTEYKSVASGDHAVAFGYGNTCSGRTTLAQGLYNIVTGKDSAAFGQRNTVGGQQAFAVGMANEITAPRNGIALGYGNKVTAQNGVALGWSNTASGDAAIAMGDACESSATSAVAMGYQTKASGASAVTLGKFTKATGTGEVAMGEYNQSITSDDASQQTAFSFGIGTSDTNRVNAFEIKKNGDVYFGGKSFVQAVIDALPIYNGEVEGV